MASNIRMGFVGAGRIFQEVHFPVLSGMADIEPLVLCDLREAALHEALKRYGVHSTTTRYQDVFSMQQLDAILITLPNYLHAKVAERALESGKHVFCEKPAGISPQEVQRIQAAADERNLVYMLSLPHRFDEQALLLKRFVQNGHIGRVQHVRAGTLLRQACPGGWCTDRERSGGGAMVHLGTQLLDLVLWLLDFPTIRRVSAACTRLMGPQSPSEQPQPRGATHNVEDAANALFRLDGDRTILLEVAWESHTAEDRQFLELHGERGCATLWPLRLYQKMEGVGVDIIPHCESSDPYLKMHRHFVDCVQSKQKKSHLAPLGSAQDGLRLAHLMHFIYRSAEAGHEVEVTTPWQVETVERGGHV